MSVDLSAQSNSTPCEDIWAAIKADATQTRSEEPLLNDFLNAHILGHNSLTDALAHLLSQQLDSSSLPASVLNELMLNIFAKNDSLVKSICCDLRATVERDSACSRYSVPFLYFKGFHALQAHRISHALWLKGRASMALLLQSHISQVYGVDIHPAATIGHGIMIDHATGVVIGETTVIGNNVSIMQSVTLGGTGKEHGDRHPKVSDGVLISAGAKILGNIHIGKGAKIGAGSVVLHDVPEHCTVAGVPAKIIGHPQSDQPALDMNHGISCDIDK